MRHCGGIEKETAAAQQFAPENGASDPVTLGELYHYFRPTAIFGQKIFSAYRLDSSNAKEFAVCAGVSYSTAREWFRLPGFPSFHGVVFWQNFECWRAGQKGSKNPLLDETKILVGRGYGVSVSLAKVPGSDSLKVFMSYCHADETLKNQLLNHLTPLKRMELIDVWHDRKIPAGGEWE